MSLLEIVNPKTLGRPRGFSHGVLAPAGARMLFVAGQTAADDQGRVSDATFAAQFAAALSRTLEVVHAAGGRPEHIARMTVYVTDMESYRGSRTALREIWERHMGTHYPAMALVEVTTLVDAQATVEIEATALIP